MPHFQAGFAHCQRQRLSSFGADGEDLHLTRPLLRFASGCSTRFAGLNHFRLLFRHICIYPQRASRHSSISNSMSICGLTSGRQLPVLPFVAVLPSKTAITMRNHGDVLELRQQSLFKCPRWATSLRGARGPVPHERCDLSALIVGCIARAAYCGGRCEKMKSTAPRYGAGGERHK